jgi:predicted nucleic acid-binding protein
VTHGFDTSLLVAHEVACHAEHAVVRRRVGELREAGGRFAIASQVVTEFVHIVTDAKRFTTPLAMEQALERTRAWWDSPDVERIEADDDAVKWFLDAMAKHRLGRKRVLDTMMAATYRSAGITSILTLNAADFAVFGEFSCPSPLSESADV